MTPQPARRIAKGHLQTEGAQCSAVRTALGPPCVRRSRYAALCRSGGDGFRAMRRSMRRPAQARHKRRLPFCRQKNRDAVSPRPGSFWHLQGRCPTLSLCKGIPCRGGRLCPPLRAVFRLQSKNAICFYLSTIGCSTFAGIEIHRNAGKSAPK